MAIARFGRFAHIRLLVLSVGLLLPSTVSQAEPKSAAKGVVQERVEEVKKRAADQYTSLETLYKYLHSHPELSLQEAQTAARLAREMKELGFEVTEKVGGHGIVCVLKNGKGPTVLVRTDMDALPVVERTGVPYASQVHVRNKNGNDVGVMHACGHDMHMIFSN
jgi:hippurate hydrolase